MITKKAKYLMTIVGFIIMIFAVYESSAAEELYINEVMASNGETLADEYGNFSDWIELYNPGPEDIDIADYYISDHLDEPFKYQIPRGYEETIIPADAYLLLWADGEEDLGVLHLPFKLSREREELILSSPQGKVMDKLVFGLQQRDVSYGRNPDKTEEWLFYYRPTPGEPNTTEGLSSLNLVDFYSFYRDNQLFVSTGIIFVFVILVLLFILLRINLKYRKGKKELASSNQDMKKMASEYETIIENTNDALCLINIDIDIDNEEFRYYRFNPAYEKLTGYRNSKARYKTPVELYGQEKGREVEKKYRRCYHRQEPITYDIEFELPAGEKVFHTNLAPVIVDGEVVQLVASLRDITERKEMEDRIRELSFHDSVTGLYNRTYFNEELKRFDTSRQLPLSIIIGDINGLKLTNDIFGHLKGDELLKRVADLIKSSCRHEDLVARWGGDEFIILLPDTDKEIALKISKRIRERVSNLGGIIKPSISLGVCTKENEKQDINDIFGKAEDMMYYDKLNQKRSIEEDIINDLRDRLRRNRPQIASHCERVKEIAVKLGRALNIEGKEMKNLSTLAEFHDLGRAIGETGEMKKHKYPLIAYQLARSIKKLEEISEGILHQHEHWDGTGYPQGLKGKEIPLFSRIIALANAYEEIRHEQYDRGNQDKEEIIKKLKGKAGKQLDPALVDVFITEVIV